MPTPPHAAPRTSSAPALALDASRSLVEGMADLATFTLDLEGRVTTWNRGAERLLGYSAAEVLAQSFAMFFPEDAPGDPARELSSARERGGVEVRGLRIRGDGTSFWAREVLSPLYGAASEMVGFVAILCDDSEAQSENSFRLLIEQVTDYAIYMLDPEGRIVTWNSGAAKIKGYEQHEIVGRHVSVFYPEDEVRAGKVEHELREADAKGRFEDEGYRVRKDGSRFWANVVITALRDRDGRLLGFAKVTKDLTVRKQAEETAIELAREQAARAAAQEAERRVRESEERFRRLNQRLELILEGIGDGITVQDASGRVIFANSAAARTTGYETVDDFLHHSSGGVPRRFDLLDEAGNPFPYDELPGRRVLRGEESDEGTLLHVRDRETGREFWSFVRARVMRDEHGRPELAINVFQDVTASHRRAQYEKALSQATAALSSSLDYEATLANLARELVPGIADWCTVQLVEGDELKTVAIAHADPEKVGLARELQKQFPPDPRQTRGVWQVIRTGMAELYEDLPDEVLVQGAQSPEHLAALRRLGLRSVIVAPIRARERVIGTFSIISAESGRRYDREALALVEELGRRAGNTIENARLYAAEKQAREHLALLARAGQRFSATIDYEETLRNVVDVVLPDLGDVAFVDVIEGAEARRVSAGFDERETAIVLEGMRFIHSVRGGEGRRELASGNAPLERSERAWLEDSATGPEHLALAQKVGLCSVITVPLRVGAELIGVLTLGMTKSGRLYREDELRLAEEIARRAATALHQARLYRAANEALSRAEEASRIKDEFLATVSHELRTPLNAIVGWAGLLRERSSDPGVLKGIEVIARNANAQVKIIEDILDVSRIITGKLRLDPRPADLVAITCDALEVVKPSAQARQLQVEFAPPEGLGPVVCDPERLQQVIWNLLSNAVKFSEPGGTIRIAIEREQGAVVFSVSDTGCGIDPNFLPFVFERFKQGDSATTRRFGGLGLGLALVRHIVELHGGTVRVQSEGVGKGATFTIVLPVRPLTSSKSGHDAPSRPKRELEAKVVAPRLDGLSVLVVDDEADARELMGAALSDAGATVRTAESASEAFEVVRAHRPDVIISDIGMPVEDGYSLLTRVRTLGAEEGGETPAIAVTAYTRDIDRKRALAAGYSAHVGKPVDMAVLIATVARLRSPPRAGQTRPGEVTPA